MVVNSIESYEERAVALATSLTYSKANAPTASTGESVPTGTGELYMLRHTLFHTREQTALFDTAQWTRNAEKAYAEMWRRWVEGTEFEDSVEFRQCTGPERQSGCIWVQ